MPAGKSKLKRRSVHLILCIVIGPKGQVGPILTSIPFAGLCEAEPVAGIVLENGLDTVWSLGGLGNESHALRFQLFVSAATVVCIEHSRTEDTLRHDSA